MKNNITNEKIHILANGKSYGFDAAIFDFDGVIVDTEKYHYASWCEAFKSVGIDLTVEDYIPLKSTGRDNTICTLTKKYNINLTSDEAEKVKRIKDDAFKNFFESISEKDICNGAIELLELLKAHNVKRAIASSASTTSVILKKLRLNEYFEVVVDGQSGLRKKPYPDIFCAAADKLNAKYEACLVFEDSFAGIEAAKSGNMQVIAVGGINSGEALMRLDDLHEFLKISNITFK